MCITGNRAFLRWQLNRLWWNWVMPYKRTGECCQRQEYNKGKSPKARVSPLYFWISKKTCVARMQWTSGRVHTSTAITQDCTNILIHFDIETISPGLPAFTSVSFQSVLYGVTIGWARVLFNSQIDFIIQKLPVNFNRIQSKTQTA